VAVIRRCCVVCELSLWCPSVCVVLSHVESLPYRFPSERPKLHCCMCKKWNF
jgi:hypothetical protein